MLVVGRELCRPSAEPRSDDRGGACEDGHEQVAPCGSPLTVVADGASVIESVCQAGHRYATCACQQPDCTGWKAISVSEHYPGVIP